MKKLYWIDKEISQLDPMKDARRIAQLTFEVKYGNPMFIYGLFSMAFSRQVAIPGIAEVLYRNGNGTILKKTRKRNEDTLLFFGLMFKYLGTPEGNKVIERVIKLHSPFKISNELNLYTLTTLATLPTRVGIQLLNKELYSEKEKVAAYYFWKEVGQIMEIENIPDSFDLMKEWCENYELSEYKMTKAGQEVTKVLAKDFAKVWFPKYMSGLGEEIYYCLFDKHLLETHGVKKPRNHIKYLFDASIKSFIRLNKLLPDGKENSLIKMFGNQYKGDEKLNIDNIGPQRDFVNK